LSTTKKIYKINNYICEFIRTNWFKPGDSNDKLAAFFVVHDSIIAKIKSADNYNIPVHTLSKICYYKEITLSDFFKILEKEYGEKLYEDYFEEKK
jgi:hypothetical protein